ncbi:GABA permease [Novosphingobium sp. PC22D]|uniref:amino acid permease n=1 Tax=Novosphingobium sp. PC22D TaxID=1962403 RepID=UPI000BF0FAAA|nr:amino acid permease [Novosphingobium sp. PC22D]PEQ12871.1 GABA permease [Novosphingobium sp. PC22D]
MSGTSGIDTLPHTRADVYPGEPQAELGQALRARHVSMIAIGGIIGAGLFVGSSTSIATAGPAVVVSYVLAGLLVMMVMRMLSEMAVAIPGVQSFPEFARHGLGDWGGFLSGWLYWYFWVVVVAIEAIAGAVIVEGWIPLPSWLIGIGLMAVLTIVNLASTRFYGEFEFWFSSLKVGAILAFIVIVAGYVLGVNPAGQPTFANLTDHGGFAPKGWMAVLAATTSVIFSLVGAEIATIAAAESSEPARVVARMTSTVALRILIFYILSVLLIVCALPWTDIVPGASPFTAALGVINIPGAALIMNIVVLIAVLSCLNSGLYVTSRVLFTLAANGDAPQALVAVNKRKVPSRSILVGTLFSYLALAASVVSPQVVFSFLVNASGAIMLIVYLIIAISQIRLRFRHERESSQPLTLRMWLFPWLSYATAAGIVAILIAMAAAPDLASQLYSSLAAVVVAMIAYWLVYRRRR